MSVSDTAEQPPVAVEAPAEAPEVAAAVEPPRTHVGWVLHSGDDPRALRRAVRHVQHAGATRTIALDRWTVCVEGAILDSHRTDAAGGGALRLRVGTERRLGGPVEVRQDCDVAWAPVGRGYVLLVVDQPAEQLEAALDDVGATARDIRRPSDPAEPVRLCLPERAVADPADLADALRDEGLVVRAVYAVGGCRR